MYNHNYYYCCVRTLNMAAVMISLMLKSLMILRIATLDGASE